MTGCRIGRHDDPSSKPTVVLILIQCCTFVIGCIEIQPMVGPKSTTIKKIMEHRYRAVWKVTETGSMRTHTSAEAGKIIATNPVSIWVLLSVWTEKFDRSQVRETKEDVSSDSYQKVLG